MVSLRGLIVTTKSLVGIRPQAQTDFPSNPSIDYFAFGTPSIPPVQFSLVMKDGPEGYACYNEGNDLVFLPGNVTAGYTDCEFLDSSDWTYTHLD
jgi:hypothetical protein